MTSRLTSDGRNTGQIRGGVDMHTHSDFSDGTLVPEELVKRAKLFAVEKLALTDHDTTGGWERSAAICLELGVEFMPGVELTSYEQMSELHILGYGLRKFSGSRLEKLLSEKVHEHRLKRFREILCRLKEAGLELGDEALNRAVKGSDSPGRPHIAAAIVEAGYAGNINEAFQRFLVQGKPGYVEKFRLSPYDAIDYIHEAGGAAVFAHPGPVKRDELIPPLFSAGLDGLEAYHPKHIREQADWYARLARKHGGIVTGGSDFHHPGGAYELGFPPIPAECWQALSERLEILAGP